MHQLAQSINNFLLQYIPSSFLKILYFIAIGMFFLILYLSYKIIVTIKESKRTEISDLVYLKYALPGEDRIEIDKR
ncbi:MAG: hypothetical protein H7Y18_07020 [Clostridiaceae bacterium]|nr:hypothetical protein [Clostridiaceae bacterium]